MGQIFKYIAIIYLFALCVPLNCPVARDTTAISIFFSLYCVLVMAKIPNVVLKR